MSAQVEVDELPIAADELSDLKENQRYVQPLPQNGAIRKIACRLEIQVTSGANAPVLTTENVDAFLHRITVKLNGRDDVLFSSLHLIREAEKYLRGRHPYGTALTTDAATTTKVVRHFNIEFAQNTLNRNDISALLQTQGLSNLQLIVETGSASDIGTNLVIDSAKVTMQVREFYGARINNSEETKMTRVFNILETKKLQPNQSSFIANSQDINLPARKALLSQILYVKDNGVPSNHLIDRFQYARAIPRKQVLIDTGFLDFHESNFSEYMLEYLGGGLAKVNFQTLLGKSLGFVTGSRSYDFLKLLTPATVVENEDTIDILSQYI